MTELISAHFNRREFACKCGCGKDTVDVDLIRICEEVRKHLNTPITPSSGNRCTIYNKTVGGSERSQHLYGRAADLPVADPLALYRWLCKRYPDRCGFGVYDSFVHVDSRKDVARWDKRSTIKLSSSF